MRKWKEGRQRSELTRFVVVVNINVAAEAEITQSYSHWSATPITGYPLCCTLCQIKLCCHLRPHAHLTQHYIPSSTDIRYCGNMESILRSGTLFSGFSQFCHLWVGDMVIAAWVSAEDTCRDIHYLMADQKIFQRRKTKPVFAEADSSV